MEIAKRAQKEKSRIRPSGETYVKPKDLLNVLERVRETARRDREWSKTVVGTPQGAVTWPSLANM